MQPYSRFPGRYRLRADMDAASQVRYRRFQNIMQEFQVSRLEQNQRLDKYLRRLMPGAQTSFLYKMLRKKNITLNGRKAAGNEMVKEGDTVRMFLSAETFQKMQQGVQALDKEPSAQEESRRMDEAQEAFRKLGGIKKMAPQVIYEDEHIAAIYKPAGVLSQKADSGDVSLNEWFQGYLRSRKEFQPENLRSYVPSVQNRLDRNTEGLVLAAKTLPGSQLLTGLQREHQIHKYYHMVVFGKVETGGIIEGYLVKDVKSNTVRLFAEPQRGADYTRTEFRPLAYSEQTCCTLVEAQLITGKTHQLRIHFASIGHPIVGDPKYGKPGDNQKAHQWGVHRQLLLCQRVEFPKLSEEFGKLSEKVIRCREPEIYRRLTSNSRGSFGSGR